VSAQPAKPEFIRSLARGLDVIRSFSMSRPRQTLSEVAAVTGLTRATARRVLLTLEQLGYVRADGRTFELTAQVLDLGYAYLSSLALGDIAQPYLEDLAERVRESSSISVLDGEDIVYVVRVPTTRVMTISLGLGSRLPAAATLMGRVLLAGLPPSELDRFLSEVELEAHTRRTITDKHALRAELHRGRDQGWALVDQELEEGLRSIAAPLRDSSGRVIAAMNISGHAGRVTLSRMREEFLPALLEAADRINQQLARR
jgi:IclR family transcriptional regulator, pca regulon regulatory protein